MTICLKSPQTYLILVMEKPALCSHLSVVQDI
jgi:hypothetical protein